MTNKTVAERLRETAENYSSAAGCSVLLHAATGELNCPPDEKAKTCWDCRRMSLNTIADMIEVEQAELRLPEGIEWPRWSTGELIKFGDVVETTKGPKKVLGIRFNIREYELYENRCEGPFIWASYGVKLKHSEPDTAESILSEMVSAIECEGCVELDPYIERYRKLMGGE